MPVVSAVVGVGRVKSLEVAVVVEEVSLDEDVVVELPESSCEAG